MSGLSSNESFIKSQESIVQGVIRTPKPINLLKIEFNNIIDRYNSMEINKKPVILVNEEKYEKDRISQIRNEQKRRRSKKTERKLDVEEHDRALSELKKYAFIMDSNNTINKKSQSRNEDDDEYDIFIEPSSSSENSSRMNSSLTINSTNSNASVNIVIEKDDSNNTNSNEHLGSNYLINNSLDYSKDDMKMNIPKKAPEKLVIPNSPTPIFNHSLANAKNDVYFSKEDVFRKKKDDEQSLDKDDYDDTEKRLNDKKKKTRLKQFLKLHKENFLLEMPNALYTDIISESIKILTKTSQNYMSQLGKKDESTIGSIKHLEHVKSMVQNANQYQQHIDNNSGKFGPGYYQLCTPIDENGQYVKLKEKVLINSLESLN